MSLTDHDLPSLSSAFAAAGLRISHAGNLLRAFYAANGLLDLDDLQLGRAVREYLGANLALRQSSIRHRHVSTDGTTKLLIQFTAGGSAESVLMPGHDAARAAGCVSSQIGCAMGCDFCASTRAGLERSLTAGEIVEQFLHLRAQAAALGRRLRTLVFMGMGEPMHNLDNVIPAIQRIAGAGMGDLGGRQITVSTVGIVPGIYRLAEAGLNVHLALSLHAPDDATRAKLVPANRRYGVAEIMTAARAFSERTGRIVTIEYCMLAGINDSDDHARMLVNLLDGFRAHVNLIPYNAIGAGVSGAVYLRPPQPVLARFLDILVSAGVVAHFRRTRGEDVEAACGQLRATVSPPPAQGAMAL